MQVTYNKRIKINKLLAELAGGVPALAPRVLNGLLTSPILAHGTPESMTSDICMPVTIVYPDDTTDATLTAAQAVVDAHIPDTPTQREQEESQARTWLDEFRQDAISAHSNLTTARDVVQASISWDTLTPGQRKQVILLIINTLLLLIRVTRATIRRM